MPVEKVHLKCFHHRIRDGHGHINQDQFLNIDPFDKTMFSRLYKKSEKPKNKKD